MSVSFVSALKQLITEPTHSTEILFSLIDLILLRNYSNILSSGVTDPFVPDQNRNHCPIIVLLKVYGHQPKHLKAVYGITKWPPISIAMNSSL